MPLSDLSLIFFYLHLFTTYIGEEHNKQEVHCLAEQVVASVLQPPAPPAPVAFPHERKESDLPSNRESGLGEANALRQTATAVDEHKIEVIKLAFCSLLLYNWYLCADFYCN